MKDLIRKIGTILVLLLILSGSAYAQSYDQDFWDNPNVIWKTSSGSIITSSFAKKMFTQGGYTIQERDLRGGRKEIKMIPPNKEPKKIPRSFNWEDPRLTVKDDTGQKVSKEMSRLLVRMDTFDWELDTLAAGPIVLTFKLEERQKKSVWDEPQVEFIKEWFKQWKGQKLPEFSLRDLDDNLVDNSIARNKILVLNFWNSNCHPCIKEMEQLNKVVNIFSDKEVVFLAPNYESAGMTNQFLQSQKFDYRILSSAQSFMDELGIQYYATHIIVDKDGTIVDINVGGSSTIGLELGLKLSRLVAN